MENQEIIDTIDQFFKQPASELLFRFVIAIAIVVFGRLIAKWLTNIARKTMVRAEVDETLVSFLGNITYYVLLLIVIIIALGVLGFPTGSLVAILGAATLAIGFAIQDSIANLASGMSIIPFPQRDVHLFQPN